MIPSKKVNWFISPSLIMANKTIGGCVRTPCPDAFCRYKDWIKNLFWLRSRIHPFGNYVEHQEREVSTVLTKDIFLVLVPSSIFVSPLINELGLIFTTTFQSFENSFLLSKTKIRKNIFNNQKTKNDFLFFKIKKHILTVFTYFLRVVLKNNFKNMENR